MDADFRTVEGDEEPPFQYPLTELDGTAVDLTTATVLFRMHIEDESASPITATAAVLTPLTAGIVTAPVFGPAGIYNAEFVVTDSGEERSFPPDRALRVVIRPRV